MKIQDVALATEYSKIDSEISEFLRHFFGLPLLPPDEESKCFTDDLIVIAGEDLRVLRSCDYIVDNYISLDSRTLSLGLCFHRPRLKRRIVANHSRRG